MILLVLYVLRELVIELLVQFLLKVTEELHDRILLILNLQNLLIVLLQASLVLLER